MVVLETTEKNKVEQMLRCNLFITHIITSFENGTFIQTVSVKTFPDLLKP